MMGERKIKQILNHWFRLNNITELHDLPRIRLIRSPQIQVFYYLILLDMWHTSWLGPNFLFFAKSIKTYDHNVKIYLLNGMHLPLLCPITTVKHSVISKNYIFRTCTMTIIDVYQHGFVFIIGSVFNRIIYEIPQ